MSWLDDAVEGIRKHPINGETMWLVGTAMTLAVELTSALNREEELADRVAELELRLAMLLDEEDVA